MDTTRASRRSGQGGMALAVALVTLMILTVMGMAIGAMGVENLNQIRRSGNTVFLIQAANGGLHELMDRIYGDGTHTQNGAYGRGVTDNSADGAGAYTTSLAGCRYWWTFNRNSNEPYCTNNLEGDAAIAGWNGLRVPPHMALLVVSADEVPRPGGKEPVRVVALVTNGFPYAIASDGTIDISDVRSVAPGQGNVRSNNNTGSTARPNIEADSVDGMTFSRNGPGTIDIDGAAGPELFNQPYVGLPNVNIASVVAQQGADPGSIKIGPAGAPFDMENKPDGLYIGGRKIHPLPAVVYVDGGIRTSGSVRLPQGLQLFVRGDVTINGSLDQETTPAPGGSSSAGLPSDKSFLFVTGDLTFNGATGPSLNLLTGGNIRQNGTSNFSGLVYAQDGTVLFNGGGTLTGSIIARAGVSNDGRTDADNLDVVFNPRVFDGVRWLGFSITGPVRTASWWALGR